MKHTKLFMPLAVALTATTPITMLTSCGGGDSGKKEEVTITAVSDKEVTCGDSLTGYKFKISKVPSDKKVTVTVNNSASNTEKVYLYEPYTSNGILSTVTCDVADDGTFTVPAGYYLAPAKPDSSDFGLTFKYQDGTNAESTQTIDGLKFNYNFSYGDDLKGGDYQGQTAKEASYWTGKDKFETYMNDCLADPTIFQNDARYSTSKLISECISAETIKGLTSFKAYFNDIVAEDDGLHIHMNYEVKGDNTSEFLFQASSTKWFKFTNFDFSFTYETNTGYTFEDVPDSNADAYTFRIKDDSKEYSLLGRFNGTFTYSVTKDAGGSWSDPETITYDNIIKNYDFDEEEDFVIPSWLSFGIIWLTYDINMGTEDETILKLRSTYAANA